MGEEVEVEVVLGEEEEEEEEAKTGFRSRIEMATDFLILSQLFYWLRVDQEITVDCITCKCNCDLSLHEK